MNQRRHDGGGKPGGGNRASNKSRGGRSRQDHESGPAQRPHGKGGSGGHGGRHGGGQGSGHNRGGHRDQRRGGSDLLIRPRGLWLHGQHAVSAALLNPRRRIHRIVLTEAGRELLQPALDQAAQAGLGRPQPELMAGPDFGLRITDAPGHAGIAIDAEPLNQPDLPTLIEKLPREGKHGLLILDQVTDPHNIGAIIRSAAAFGALAVVAQDRHSPEETAIMAKTASGGMEHVPYVKVTNISRTLTWLGEHDFLSIGLDERGDTTLAATALPERIAFVLGAEGDGLRRLVGERCNRLVRLPTQPPIASLNVSNAAAITLYEWQRLAD